MNLSKPEKWSAECPNLYTLVASLKKGGQYLKPFLSKSVSAKSNSKATRCWSTDRRSCLKSQPTRNGSDYGYYISTERMIQDIRLMKEHNVNAVSTCHYPDNNLWYDLCDKYGIYVVAEANVEAMPWVMVNEHG
jgi:beta-galactosidase